MSGVGVVVENPQDADRAEYGRGLAVMSMTEHGDCQSVSLRGYMSPTRHLSPEGDTTKGVFMGYLGQVDNVAASRPVIVICAALAEAAAGVRAAQAIADHAPIAVSSFNPTADLPDGLVRVGLWLLWTIAVSGWLFTTPGRFKFSRAERERLDDELVIHHRAIAYRVGFIALALLVVAAAIAAAAGQLVVWWPVAALSSGLFVTAVTFAGLDMRDA